MVEDVITALSRTRSLFVIARSSSFAYKGRSPDIRLVGRELGVRYVLEGSVRKAGSRVRITGQLIEAEIGIHLWADRFESGIQNIFELQDQVTSSVVGAIAPTLEQAEIARSSRKPTENLQAYDYYLRGMACLYNYSEEANQQALELLRKAGDLDPNFALSFAQASWCYSQRLTFGWAKDRVHEAIEAELLARRALGLDRSDPRVLATVGWVLVYVLRRIREGADLVDQALHLDPNFAIGWTWRGFAKLWLGVENPSDDFEHALRLVRSTQKLHRRVRNGVCPSFRRPIRRCIIVGCKSAGPTSQLSGRVLGSDGINGACRECRWGETSTGVVSSDRSRCTNRKSQGMDAFAAARRHREARVRTTHSPGCPNDRAAPPCRDPGSRCGRLLKAHGQRRGRNAGSARSTSDGDHQARRSPRTLDDCSSRWATASWSSSPARFKP